MLDSTLSAEAINHFPAVKPEDEQLLTMTISQLQGLIREATGPILQELQDLRDEVAQLKEDREKDHQKVVALEIQQDRDFEEFADKINEHSTAINTIWKAVKTTPVPTGKKTTARIDRLKSILKARGGTVSFKELRRELGLKPNQFSALVAKLDKRVFQVITNSRAKDEKALRLRAFT